MSPRAFSVSATIPAPPTRVYAILADYRDGHPRILPEPAFQSLTVEAGGVGAGTRIRVEMRLLGRLQSFRAEVSEPEPGRVLVETTDTGYVTTFRVEPRMDGDQAQVTFTTELPARSGVAAALEFWLVRRLLRPVYERELALLAQVAAEGPRSAPP